jgi:hypothetical protein
MLLRSLLPSQDDSTRKRVEGMIRARDIASLAQLGQIQDHEYQDSEFGSVSAERQIAALFKKNDAFADERRCTENAIETFERGERICAISNKRLDWYHEHPERIEPVLAHQLKRMEQDIAYLLRDPSQWLEKYPETIRLTNGATEDRSRVRSAPFLKITGKVKGPRRIIPYVARLLLYYGVDFTSLKFVDVSCNVITLVKKNWKTFRTIAKEATHSLPFQLSLDTFFKGLLRRWGINLSSQTKNQEMARKGSIDGSIATIDLEMASDTLCLNAVAWMLPVEWFEVLTTFRSSSYRAPWGTGHYAKFSSMGNGFTFTLETLIFAAACRAVGSQQYAVYGDDIAIETELAPSVVRLLRFLGFKTNGAKSFISPHSRFRESCGCDYYKGHLLTPFYLRELPKESDRSGMSHVLNGLVACSCPGPLWDWIGREVKRLGLRVVPWNSDSRSGVFATPNYCWRTKKLRVHRRRGPTDTSPLIGFPVFNGYAPVQTCRKTLGWRSYFLWFLKKNYGEQRLLLETPNRTTAYLLQLNEESLDNAEGTATVTSSVGIRTFYVHKTRRYDPKPTLTPSYLFLWDEVLGG